MKIIMADSRALCREALCNYIEYADPELRIVGVSDYAALQKMLQNEAFDGVLVDSVLPGMPYDFLRGFSASWPKSKLGVLAADHDGIDIMPLRSCSIFSRNLSCKEFLAGLHDMLAGGVFQCEMRAFVPYGVSYEPLPEKLPLDRLSLTPREKEVLSYLLTGAANKDIARALDLQVVTVKLHVRGICRKIGAKNRTQAALIAREHGLDRNS